MNIFEVLVLEEIIEGGKLVDDEELCNSDPMRDEYLPFETRLKGNIANLMKGEWLMVRLQERTRIKLNHFN